MLKPEEIRRGNKIYLGENIYSVININGKRVHLLSPTNKDSGALYSVYLNLCSPVKITLEWLNAFGFEIVQDNTLKFKEFYFQYTHEGTFVLIDNGNGFTTITSCMYLHHLQNLVFDLTGEIL